MKMVGYLHSPTTEELAAAEEKRTLKNQSPSNDPLDLCLPEIDDFSSCFADSFLDFDSIDNWFLEGKQMADEDGYLLGFGSNGGGSVVTDKNLEVGGDGSCEQNEVRKEFDGKVDSLEDKNAETKAGKGGFGEDKLFVNLGDLGCLVEKQLGEVSLDGPKDSYSSVVNGDGELKIVKDHGVCDNDGLKNGETANSHGNNAVSGTQDDVDECNNGIGVKSGETLNEKEESDTDIESEDESSSSSSSASSSLSSSDDEDEGGDKNVVVRGKKKAGEEECDVEEGEILLSDAEEMVAWSDNEDEDAGGGCVTGPIRSKNELQVLPPVPSVSVTLQPHHQTQPVGVILSIMGAQVIVEGVEAHNPLNEGSILWITESRLPLGIVDEIFGPVKNPYYIVRYNSENEVPDGIQQGTSISFVPEFVSHVLNDKSVYSKGYDASGENDEELSDDLEFSDDEKEAEYRRMLKMKKRASNDAKPGIKAKEKKHFKNQVGNRNRHNQFSSTNIKSVDDKSLVNENQPFPPPIAKPDNTCSSGLLQGFPSGSIMPAPSPLGLQASSFVAPNGIFNNAFPYRPQQNLMFPNGMPAQGMPWIQQNQPFQLYQSPLQNPVPFQQQFNTFPGLSMGYNSFSAPLNFIAGPSITAGPAFLNQSVFSQPQLRRVAPAPHTASPPNAGGQVIQSDGSQNTQASPAASGKPQLFNQGRGGGGGAQHRGRGRNFGGRGRNQNH